MKTMRRLPTKFIAVLIIVIMSFSMVQPMLEVYAAPSTPVLDYDTITNGIGNRLIAIDQSKAANLGQAGYKNEDYGYFLLDKKATYHMQGSGDPTPFDRFPTEVVTVIPAPGQTQKTYTEGTHYKFTDTGTQIEFYPLPALWDEMVRDDDNVDAVDTVTFRFRWYFKGEPVVGQDVYHEKLADVTFYRPTYRFSNIEILDGSGNVKGNRANPVAANHYFNTENRTVKVRVTLEAFDPARSAELAQAFNPGDVGLFKGNVGAYSAGNELHSQPQTEKSGNTVTYTFDFQGRDATSEDQGITFAFKGNINNMAITSSGVDWGFRDSKATYFSNCKVDTKLPEFAISNVESGTSTVWARTHKLRVNPSEPLAGSIVEYYLTPQELPLADYTGGSSGGTKTRQVFPVGADTILNLKLDGKYEGKYTLRVEGTDLAGNKSHKDEPVWLDNMAPRASAVETPHEQAVDGSKSFDYKFDIEDQSGKGRVYYCFVKDGDAVPAKGSGQWLFVELNGTTTTAVCKVAAGENFIGKLYYYTADDFGNDSYQESGAYYSQEIRIYNDLVTTQPVIQDASKGRSSYAISYDGEGKETLQYRWIDENIVKIGFVQAAFTTYTGTQDIGAAVHIGDDGKQYTFDGTYKLVYKITNTTSGNYVQGEYTFVFDNSVPSIELPVWTNGTKIRDTQQALIRISDKGAIKEAAYRIVDIDNTPIEGIQEIPIAIENDGSVNTLVNISLPEGISSGIYGIRIKATDENGNYKETGYNYADKTPAAADDGRQAAYYANPAMRLAIRKDKPELILNKVSDGYGAPLEFYNGAYRVGESDYRINLEAREHMRNIGELSYTTYLKYQTSADGESWSEWKATGLGGMYTDPETDISEQALDIVNPYPLNAGVNSIYIRTACYNYDQPAGDGQEELERNPGEKCISAPVIVNVVLDQTPAQYTISYEPAQRTNGNVTATLTIDDTSGKTYQAGSGTAGVTVEEISANKEYRVTISQNVDTVVWIKNNLGITTYAPVKVGWIDREGPSAVLVGSSTITAGERKDAELKVTIKDTKPGTTELALTDYANYSPNPSADDFIRFNDLVSQGKIKVVMLPTQENQYGEREETYTLTFRGMSGRYFLGYRSEDSLGNKTSAEIMDAGNDINLTDAQIKPPSVAFEPQITKSQTVATVKFNVPVAVLPDSLVVGDAAESLRRAAEYAKTADARFLEEYKFVYSEARDRTYFVADQVGRAEKIDFGMEEVQFLEGYKSSLRYLLKGQEVQVNGGSWIGLEKNGDLQVEVSSNADYQQYFYTFSSLGGGMSVNKTLSSIAQNPPQEVVEAVYEAVYAPEIYTKLVLDVLINGREDKQAQFSSYTMEGLLQDRQQAESITIGNIDEVFPEVFWSLDTTAPTNKPVAVYIFFKDEGSGIAKVEEKEASGNYVEISAAEYSADNRIIRTVYDREDIKAVRVTDKAGLVTEVSGISAPNIDKTPIEEGKHYTVSYSYENYKGEWKPIVPGNYYRSVKAVVTPAAAAGKTLSISNNNGSFERLLGDDKSFVFDIGDSAGNKTQQTVQYGYYDNQAPNIAYTIFPVTKTNKPVTVTITAADNRNAIDGCELYCKKGNQLVKLEGVAAGANSGEYTAEVKDSGQYEIHVWDEAGNKGIKTMDITNIDYSPVEIKEITYSVPQNKKTNQTVLATIKSFNKDSVTMLGIEIPQGVALTSNDIVCAMDSTNIRFKKNGSVEATFVDAYGNIGSGIITVDNITTAPPKCEGVVTLAPNATYATISFDSARGPAGERLEPDLGKIYVVSGIINSAAVVTADKASVRVNDNGTYNFTLSDEVGNSQSISVTVAGIDKTPPKVTGVSWKYDYLQEDLATSQWKTVNASGTDSAPGESNYALSGDKAPETNQAVEVTVTTDKDITQIGSFDDTPRKDTAFIYSRNGVFSYNLEALNGTRILYPVNVKLIDKDKPVIKFDNTSELIFVEGDTRAESKYDISKLYDFTAYDVKNGETLEMAKEKVKVDFGSFDPTDINKNEFNRNKPYFITYTLTDGVGNTTEVTRTVRLIGMTDTLALINGNMPNANSMASVEGTGEFTVSLKNCSGKAYVKYMPGIYTMGEMKYTGEAVAGNTDESFKIKVSATGWYTVNVQTDKKDFFNILVYVKLKDLQK